MTKLEIFNKLEKKHDLFSLNYKGIPFWQLIRVDIYRMFTRKGEAAVVNNNNSNRALTISRLVRTFVKRRKVNLLHSDVLRVNVNYPGDFISDEGYIDRALQNMELESMYSIQDIYVNTDGKKASERVVVFPMKEIELMFIRFLNHIFLNVKLGEIEKNIKVFLEEANGVFNNQISIKDVRLRIKNSVEGLLCLSSLYAAILEKVSPKIIILDTAYDIKCFSLIYEAKKRNIPTIEVMHGFISGHDAYTYLDLSSKGKILPNYLFTHGDYWTKHIKMPNCVSVKTVGNAYADAQIKKYPDSINRRVIAFFSGNAGYGTFLSKELVKCMPKLKEMGYKVIYKFHPNERNGVDDYPWLKEFPEIEYYDGNSSPYEVISKSGVIVSYDSTVMSESFLYDNRLIINYIEHESTYSIAFKKMGVITVRNKSEFFDILSSEFHKYEEAVWKKNAAENIRQELIYCIK